MPAPELCRLQELSHDQHSRQRLPADPDHPTLPQSRVLLLAPALPPRGRVPLRLGLSRVRTRRHGQGLRISIADLGYMGSFVSRANPDFCRTVLRLSDSIVTNTAHCYLRNII